MNQQDFIRSYKTLRDRLGKRQITDQYIDFVAEKFKVENWLEDIAREVFEDFSVADPYKVDISAGAITGLYWAKVRDKKKNSFEKVPCSKGLCNGQGLVILYQDNYIDAKLGNYGYLELAYSCVCMIGYDQPKDIKRFDYEMLNKGWKVKKESVYSKIDFADDQNSMIKRKEFYKELNKLSEEKKSWVN